MSVTVDVMSDTQELDNKRICDLCGGWWVEEGMVVFRDMLICPTHNLAEVDDDVMERHYHL